MRKSILTQEIPGSVQGQEDYITLPMLGRRTQQTLDVSPLSLEAAAVREI